MKNPFHSKKPAPQQQKTSETQNASADSLQQRHFSKKEKLQAELQTNQAIEGLQNGQKKLEQDLKKMEETGSQWPQEIQNDLQELRNDSNEQARVLERLAQQQKAQGLELRNQATIQEAMERADAMYRRLLHVVSEMSKAARSIQTSIFESVQQMLESQEEMRKHLELLVKIKTDIHLDAEQIKQIAEPVSAEMRQYVDTSLERFNEKTIETLETTLSQSFSEYSAAQEEAVLCQEAAAQRTEQAAQRAELAAEQALGAVSAQEANRGWQQQMLATLGTVSLQAASVILGAFVFLGPIAAILGLSGTPGFMQWLTAFGSQGAGQAFLAVLIAICGIAFTAVLMAVTYRLVDGALKERKGEKALSNMGDSIQLSRARRRGDDVYMETMRAQAQRKLDEERRQDEA